MNSAGGRCGLEAQHRAEQLDLLKVGQQSDAAETARVAGEELRLTDRGRERFVEGASVRRFGHRAPKAACLGHRACHVIHMTEGRVEHRPSSRQAVEHR